MIALQALDQPILKPVSKYGKAAGTIMENINLMPLKPMFSPTSLYIWGTVLF